MRVCPHVLNNEEKEIAIVLEYMDCADLSHILSHHQIRLSIAQCKYIMQQILQGLASMHSCKLMHRDIKVPNILLNKHGQVKLGDLGCTTSFQNRSIFSNTVCTLWYRAPELLMGTRTYDDKVDIWSAAYACVHLQPSVYNTLSVILCCCLLLQLCVYGANYETQFYSRGE